MDDTHTYHIWYSASPVGVSVPPEATDPFYFEMTWEKEGQVLTDFTNGQDIMAWVTQGSLAQRHLEKLGQSDVGILLYRQLLEEQIDKAERGEDPIEVYRDAAENQFIALPRERVKHVARIRRGLGEQRDSEGGERRGGGFGDSFLGEAHMAPEYQLALQQYRRWVQELRTWAASDGIEVPGYEPPEVNIRRQVTALLALGPGQP